MKNTRTLRGHFLFSNVVFLALVLNSCGSDGKDHQYGEDSGNADAFIDRQKSDPIKKADPEKPLPDLEDDPPREEGEIIIPREEENPADLPPIEDDIAEDDIAEDDIAEDDIAEEDPQPEDTNCHKGDPFACEVELAILKYSNEHRLRSGRRALSHHPGIAYASRRWSASQARSGRIGHGDFSRGSKNQRSRDYLAEFGRLDVTMGGENVAMFSRSGTLTAEQIAAQFVKQWWNSSGHRRNMLRTDVTLHGAGFVRKGNAYYATQIIGNKI